MHHHILPKLLLFSRLFMLSGVNTRGGQRTHGGHMVFSGEPSVRQPSSSARCRGLECFLLVPLAGVGWGGAGPQQPGLREEQGQQRQDGQCTCQERGGTQVTEACLRGWAVLSGMF